MEKPISRSWGAFLRLWFVMAFSYFLLKFLFNLTVLGWIDLRRVAFEELALLPLGQSIVLWTVTRRGRAVRESTTPMATG